MKIVIGIAPGPYEKLISSLNGVLEKDVQKATHLVANSLVRTFKMLAAVSVVPHICNESWIIACKGAGCFVAEDEHYLIDKVANQS